MRTIEQSDLALKHRLAMARKSSGGSIPTHSIPILKKMLNEKQVSKKSITILFGVSYQELKSILRGEMTCKN
ncbi:hypothetical protein A134_23280 [Vibrio crassostreae 9CS106]|uniref:Uncharacterized protein n=1 Tax=Vibrio crassostreae 9CS106 TaxID=1191300 RepID=A0A1B1C3N5_9VIBR|nr:hypothetical protein A134_23280 [Vibrio crassostreae 9CS106]